MRTGCFVPPASVPTTALSPVSPDASPPWRSGKSRNQSGLSNYRGRNKIPPLRPDAFAITASEPKRGCLYGRCLPPPATMRTTSISSRRATRTGLSVTLPGGVCPRRSFPRDHRCRKRRPGTRRRPRVSLENDDGAPGFSPCCRIFLCQRDGDLGARRAFAGRVGGGDAQGEREREGKSRPKSCVVVVHGEEGREFGFGPDFRSQTR